MKLSSKTKMVLEVEIFKKGRSKTPTISLPGENIKKLTQNAFDTKPCLVPINNIIPSILYRFLCYAGLIAVYDNNIRQRIMSSVMPIFMYLVTPDMFLSQINTNMSFIEKVFINVAGCTIPVACWHIMRCRRQQLTMLLQSLQRVSTTQSGIRGNIIITSLLLMPLLYSLVVTSTLPSAELVSVYTYGLDIGTIPLKTAVLGVQLCLHFLVHPVFNNVLALLYSTLCVHCCSFMQNLTSDVENCLHKNFKTSEQRRILAQKEKIDHILEDIEKVFSLPLFLITVANILACSSIIGYLIERKHYGLNVDLQWAFYMFNVFGCLALTFWAAGGVPIELSAFKQAYYKKAHSRMLEAEVNEGPKIERWVFDKPDFVLTGYGLFPYRRSSLLAVAGGLLTYTVLVFSLESTKD